MDKTGTSLHRRAWVAFDRDGHAERDHSAPKRSWPPFPEGTVEASIVPCRGRSSVSGLGNTSGGRASENVDPGARGVGDTDGELADMITHEGPACRLRCPDSSGGPAHDDVSARWPRWPRVTWEQEVGTPYRREPIGVVGAITPWNYRSIRSAAKVHRRWPQDAPSS